MAVVQKLRPQIKEAVGADGVLIAQFNGAAAGQTVFHLHVHIIPRKEGTELKPHAGIMADQAQARRHRREDPEEARDGLSQSYMVKAQAARHALTCLRRRYR